MANSFTFLGVLIFFVIFVRVFTYENNDTVEIFNQTDKVKTNSTEKCLKTLLEVEQELASIMPAIEGQPTNNYHNISRALFPPNKQPSIYVKITIQFINESADGRNTLFRKKRPEKFTWSESRNFVSVEFLSLEAMRLMSLGTIWPMGRRDAELVLTVHPLCEGAGIKNNFEDNDDMWKFILLQLQDIAILPNISDPRLNTAQIVVKGHEGDKEQLIDYPKDGLKDRSKCWMIWFSSMLVAMYFGWYTINWFTDSASKPAQETILAFSVICVLGSIGFSIAVLVIESTKSCFAIAYSIINFLFLIIIIICIAYHYIKKHDADLISSPAAALAIINTWYFITHHSMWVLCGGISSEPTWAIPLFLMECFAAFIIVCAIHLFCLSKKSNAQANHKSGDKSGDKSTPMVVLHLVVGVLAVTLTTLTAAFSFVHHTSVPTENMLEVIIGAVLLWLMKNSGIFSPVNTKKGKREEEEEKIPMGILPPQLR